MAIIHNLGFPRVGPKRELKFALEAFWDEKHSFEDLQKVAHTIQTHNWQVQNCLDIVPCGDFSMYDQVLDTSFLVGNLPERVKNLPQNTIDNYFRLARGRAKLNDPHAITAGEMTKWFDTNYHYIVPEVTHNTEFSLNPEKLLTEIENAKKINPAVKPVIIGPLTYL